MDWVKQILIWIAVLLLAVPFWIFGLATVFGLCFRIFDETVLDPRRIRLIEKEFSALGYPQVKIEKWHAHFSIRYRKDGKSHYVKCTVRKGQIEWIGAPPEKQS